MRARWKEWVVLLLAVTAPAAAFAGAMIYPSPESPRIVRFRFDPNETYTLFLRSGMVTDIQLPAGARMRSLALGDTIRWVTAQSGNNLFVKPTRPGLRTSASIVTNHRVYQMMLVSVGKGKTWYQQVSWNSPGIVLPLAPAGRKPSTERNLPAGWQGPAGGGLLVRGNQFTRGRTGVAQRLSTRAGADGNPMTGVDPSKLHFAYRVSGSAPFRPNKIFDDGHFTWIQIPRGAWVMPALFIVRKGSFPGARRYVLTNYDTKGDWLIVQRTFTTAVLRADGETVTLHRLGTGG